MPLLLHDAQAPPRNKPDPILRITRQTVDERSSFLYPAGVPPVEWCPAKQPVRSRQPKRTSWLEGNIEILARRNLFGFAQLRLFGSGMEKRAETDRPPGSIQPSPGMTNPIATGLLGHPVVAIKIKQYLLMIRNGVRNNGNPSAWILVRLLQVAHLPRFRRKVFLPVSFWFKIPERWRH